MNRLDKELVIRNLVDTRTKAQELIKKGVVKVNDKVQTKSSLLVEDTDTILITENEILRYVSRGGLKLEKALNVFQYNVSNKIVMDIGSSTGGFTDCCLQNGAKKVICIDVGTNVMHPSLRQDSRIELYENTNIKDVKSELFKQLDLVVVDVSFISLEKIITKISSQNVKLDIICLIKPQFECGRDIATKYHGIVKNKTVHNEILNKVLTFFNNNNFYIKGLDFSPIQGGDGNIEYLGIFTNKITENSHINTIKTINNAFKLKK